MSQKPVQPHLKHPARARAEVLPAWMTEELIAMTLRVWQPFYPSPLTREDAIAIMGSVGRLFGVLSRR